MKYMFRKDYVLGESLNALFNYFVSNIMRELILLMCNKCLKRNYVMSNDVRSEAW